MNHGGAGVACPPFLYVPGKELSVVVLTLLYSGHLIFLPNLLRGLTRNEFTTKDTKITKCRGHDRTR